MNESSYINIFQRIFCSIIIHLPKYFLKKISSQLHHQHNYVTSSGNEIVHIQLISHISVYTSLGATSNPHICFVGCLPYFRNSKKTKMAADGLFCKFNQYGYCKFGSRCKKFHTKETCLNFKCYMVACFACKAPQTV